MMYDSTVVGVTGASGVSPPVFPSPRWEEEKKRVEGGGGGVGSQPAKIKNNLHIQY